MAKTRDYWRKRFELLEDAQHRRSLFYYAELEKTYLETMKSLEADILRWYERFAKNEGITLDEAKQLIRGDDLKEFKWSVEDYIEYGQKNAINQQWVKQLENASSRVHISRLESLKIQLQHHVEKLYGGQIAGFERLMKEAYQEQYYHTAFEVQSAFNVGFTFQKLDEARLTQIISKPWTADNMTFSAKIWRDRGMLIDTLHKELTMAIAKGESPHRLISVMQKKMNTSRSNAARLVLTESAFFSSAAQKEAFKELDVEKYEIVATLDSRTSDVCQTMDGRVFALADYSPGTTAHPFHPRCRTTTAPYFEDDYSERIARNFDGKVHYVPSDMKYGEWKEKATWNKESLNTKKEIRDESDQYPKVYPIKQSQVSWQDYINVNEAGSDLLNKIHTELNEFMNTQRLEKLYLVNKSDNSIAYELMGESIDKVGFTKELAQTLKKAAPNSLILTHVHPSPTPFSSADIEKFIEFKSIAELTLECADGSKYVLSRGNLKSGYLYLMAFDHKYNKIYNKVAKKYPELDDEVKRIAIWDKFIFDVNTEVARAYDMTFKKVE